MFDCATLQHVIQCECDAKSLIYRICLPDMLSYVSYVYADKFKILEYVLKNCLPSARMHACVECVPLRQRHVVNAAMQNV